MKTFIVSVLASIVAAVIFSFIPNEQILGLKIPIIQFFVLMSIVLFLIKYNESILKATRVYRKFIPLISASVNLIGIVIIIYLLKTDLMIGDNTLSVNCISTICTIAFLLTYIDKQLMFNKTEQISNTATCIPFQRNGNNELILWLVENPNFNMWQFPGGHVDLNSSRPDEVAINKARSEAGLGVELIDPDKKVVVEYNNCKPLCAPQFQYLLTIEKEAKCRKTLGHEYHLDHSYIGNVIKVYNDRPKFNQIDINLGSKDIYLNSNMVYQKIMEKIDSRNPNRGARSSDMFPRDMADRITAACKVYDEVME